MVTTITIVLIMVNVLKAMQHKFTAIQNTQQEVILPIDFIFPVFHDFIPISITKMLYMLSKYRRIVYHWGIIL